MASSSSATKSSGSSARFICDCGRRAKMFTSWSLKNPGRRFYTCCQMSDIRCDYFEWFDGEIEGRHGDVITNLNNRRIFLGEKIRLLEETIDTLQAKLAKKKEKKRVKEMKRVMCVKICSCVLVAILAAFIVKFASSGV